MKKDFLSIADFSQKEIWNLLLLAKKLKKNKFSKSLQNKCIGLIFQKPSTRTAVSFAVGIGQLGGQPLILNADILQIKRGESPKDTGRVLSRYLDAIVIRANRHDEVLEMASHSTVPVINGLTDREHPCQVLADLLTIMEKKKLTHPKKLKGIQVAYLGDGNNMAQSWMLAAALLGIKLKVGAPISYQPSSEYRMMVDALAENGKADIEILSDAHKVALGAHVLYTDVWASMGQEDEYNKRKEDFAPYQLNQEIVKLADPKVMVMHCLPAHRGEEITDEVLEGPHSVVFDQAENRLHVQKAVLMTLMKKGKK